MSSRRIPGSHFHTERASVKIVIHKSDCQPPKYIPQNTNPVIALTSLPLRQIPQMPLVPSVPPHTGGNVTEGKSEWKETAFFTKCGENRSLLLNLQKCSTTLLGPLLELVPMGGPKTGASSTSWWICFRLYLIHYDMLPGTPPGTE